MGSAPLSRAGDAAAAFVRRLSQHRSALLQAVFVTFLWSTSWILIKVGLNDLALGPLTFAGLRYFIAALVLLPLAAPGLRRASATDPVRRRRVLGATLLLGLILYAITQGAQFAALVHLPSVAVALALSTTPVLISVATLLGGERRPCSSSPARSHLSPERRSTSARSTWAPRRRSAWRSSASG